jgi:hypothetical protein
MNGRRCAHAGALIMDAGSQEMRRARADARADLVRRMFAVAISVGFAATLAKMNWVQNGALPGPAELNQTIILVTALLAAVLGWESHLAAMTERPLFGFWRFLVNLVLVFIYMFLLMASAHPECVLWTLAVIFLLYVVCDVLMMREQTAGDGPALDGAPRADAAQIWNVYVGGFAGRPQVSPGPAITLAWTGYFVVLALIANGRAYAHIRTTCVFALIGLVGFWIDAAPRDEHRAAARSMALRMLLILIALIAAAVYFRLMPAA